ncbi:threonine/serine exporter family protein [Desulforhopalus sp. 52FAK]
MVNSDKDIQEIAFDEACSFIIKLGTTVHGYGPNAIRLESYLHRLTEALGYHGVFKSTPRELFFAFSKEGDLWQRTHLANMPGTGLDLAKLTRVGKLVDDVIAGHTTIKDALSRLEEIDKTPHPWGLLANAISYVFIGSGFAVLLSGSWWDILFSAIFSLVVYTIVLLVGRFGARANEWLPLSSAFIAGVMATMTKVLVPELNVVLVTLSAILVLIPGYSISVGIIELTSGHVVSGTVNLMNGLVYLVKQFVGAWLGVGLIKLGFTMQMANAVSVSPSWLWIGVPILIIGLCTVFQTSPKDFIWASLGCFIAYGGVLLGSALAGANLGNLVGTTITVVFANIWAANFKRPTSIVLLPAIVLLVSGSIGFRGLAAIAVGQTGTGEQQLVQMFVVALTIAAGLLVGNTIVRPKVTL